MKKVTLSQDTTGTNAENDNSSNSLINRIPVDGTPFTIVEIEKGYFLALGNYRLTEVVEDENELYNLVIAPTYEHNGHYDWNFLLTVVNAIVQASKK